MKTTILVMALVLLFSSAVIAQSSPPPPPSAVQQELGKWWKNSEIVQKLQLSETQIDQIEQNFLNFRPMLAHLTAELKSGEERLSVLMSADSLDDAKVLAQTEFIAETRASLEKANSSMMIAIRKDLTKEQWAKLEGIRLYRTSGMLASTPQSKSGPFGKKIYTFRDHLTVPPKCVYQPVPSYTQEAKDAKAEGIILLQAIIRKDGQVTDVKILQGLGYGLDESAINTIREKWRFEPGTLNGQPVDVMANIEVSFRLY
jgi:TonB family protein